MIHSMLLDNMKLKRIENDIYSVIPEEEQSHHYDKAALFYDLIIGNRFYNRVLWGNWPSQYQGFCRRALASKNDGMVLDAGCGSLVFTAKIYAKSECPIVLLDRSLGMLRRARDRLIKYAGRVPENIILIQADIFNMPFLKGLFSTVQSFGMLHIFENTENLLNELHRVKADHGKLFLSSLAANNKLGEKYLQLLQQQKEVALCQSSELLQQRLMKAGGNFEVSTIGNMAYFVHHGQNA